MSVRVTGMGRRGYELLPYASEGTSYWHGQARVRVTGMAGEGTSYWNGQVRVRVTCLGR